MAAKLAGYCSTHGMQARTIAGTTTKTGERTTTVAAVTSSWHNNNDDHDDDHDDDEDDDDDNVEADDGHSNFTEGMFTNAITRTSTATRIEMLMMAAMTTMTGQLFS